MIPATKFLIAVLLALLCSLGASQCSSASYRDPSATDSNPQGGPVPSPDPATLHLPENGNISEFVKVYEMDGPEPNPR